MYQMPEIDLDLLKAKLSPAEFKLVQGIVATSGKNKGRLRASKPNVDFNDPDTGRTAYIWRMVAFHVSPIPQHHCIPCTADFDLVIEGDDVFDRHNKRVAETKRLDALVDQVVDTIPMRQWHGVIRWGRALGRL